MAAANSRLAALDDVDAVFEVLSDDDRPTLIVELTEHGTLPAHVVFQNLALTALLVESTEELNFDDWIQNTSNEILKAEKDFACYAGRNWSSRNFRRNWKLVYTSSEVPKEHETLNINTHLSTEGSLQSTAVTLKQRPGNICHPLTPLSLALDISLAMDKPRRKLADWTMADAASPWFRFVKMFPWSDTPYGPIESWTMDLRRSAVGIMSSPDPRVLFWGDEQAMMYNEAFASSIGDYHPSSLGLPLQAVEADGIFDILKDRTQKIFDGGKGSSVTNHELIVERNGSLEQTFWNFHLAPLPGQDGYANSVIGEFTEVTEVVLQDQRRAQGVDIFEAIAKIETLPELWSQFLGTLEEDAADISYAMVYTALEKSSHFGPTELPTPSDIPLMTPPAETTPSAFTEQLQLVDSVGLEETAFEPIVNLAAADTCAKPSLAGLFREALETQEIIAVRDGQLPHELSVEVPGVGPVNSACILPVLDLNGKPLALIALGINPRRPYTEQTSRFIYYIREAICKHAILITLPEEQRKFQKKYEETTVALSHQLQMSILKAKKKEEKFLRIARSAPLGMYLYSPKDKTIHVNEAYLKMTGATKESLQKESVSGLPWLQTVAEEYLEVAVAEWQHLMNKKTPSAIEYKVRCQTAEEAYPRWVSATSFPDVDEHGEVVLIHGWLADISDKKHKELLLAQRLEDALETKKATEHFLDMVSHEMRNPLSAIFQSTDEILETVSQHLSRPDSSPIPTERLRLLEDAAQTIALCAHHQKGIFDDILTVSKLDSSCLTIMPERVRPLDVVQRALKMYEQEARRSDIKTLIDVHDTYREHVSEFVMLDPNRLLQVIINLLTNAIKYTRSSKERLVKICLRASTAEPTGEDLPAGFMPSTPKKITSPLTPNLEHDEFSAAFQSSNAGEDMFLHFTVQDSGCGLTESEMKLLFKRFSQPKTYKQYGGSGLGLYLSKELIELQHGRIGVRSTENVGTSFAFYIKCKRFVDASASGKGVSPQPDATISSPRKGHRPRVSRTEAFEAKDFATIRQPTPGGAMHVLVVEDNLINQTVMAKQLRNAGCTVHTANHGVEALHLLSLSCLSSSSYIAGHPPPIPLEIILMDVEMPVMDGLTCIRKIREMEREGLLASRVPVVAVTANARAEQIEAALEAGMDDVVTKPFRIPELMSQMKALVKHD